MEPTEDTGTGGGRRTVVLVVSLVAAFLVGFLIMRLLPFWLGLPLLVLLVVAARVYKLRTGRP